MGGRFGKYGDHKRHKALQRGRSAISKLKGADGIDYRNRSGLLPPARSALPVSAAKTYKTAVVAMPPDHLWAPIQRLRKQYDRHCRRWMPHITLLYPFRPVSAFEQVVPLLSHACNTVTPFEVRLTRFDLLSHSRRSVTLCLVPEPSKALKALQTALWKIVPDCGDVRRFAGGFTPHLSVGQTYSQHAPALRAAWQATWQPIVFTLEYVYMIWRNDPPDDLFRLGPVLSLGGQPHNH